jgi:hypothetical protein
MCTAHLLDQSLRLFLNHLFLYHVLNFDRLHHSPLKITEILLGFRYLRVIIRDPLMITRDNVSVLVLLFLPKHLMQLLKKQINRIWPLQMSHPTLLFHNIELII